MISRTTGIFLIAGIILGVIACLGMLVLTQAGSSGDCTAILPPVSIGQLGTGSDMGNIPEFSSEDQAQKFLISHTDTGISYSGTSTGIPAPGTTAVITGQGGDRTWSFDVDTSTFKPDEYIVTAGAVQQDAEASTLFNVLDPTAGPLPVLAGSGSSPGSGGAYYISIDPVSNHYVGDRFTITGTTNIPADDEVLVQVYSSSFTPTDKSQSGEFSGATGTVKAVDASPEIAPVSTGVPGLQDIAPSEDRKYSTTNVQVGGVDEADIVRTNGTYIY